VPDSTTALAIINGTLIDGAGADPIKDAVLIVQGDPLQDLKALSSVQYVIHNGEVIREP
jgi:hypothetical protein